MKRLITTIAIFCAFAIQAQIGDAAVVATLEKIEVANKVDRVKSITELRSQLSEIRKQSELIHKAQRALERVSNGISQMQLVNDIKNNSIKTVEAYTNSYTTLKHAKVSPAFIQYQMQKLEAGLQNNKKLIAFFSSVLKDDLFSMKDYERIQLLEQINAKVIGNLTSVNAVRTDLFREVQSHAVTDAVSSFPVLD